MTGRRGSLVVGRWSSGIPLPDKRPTTNDKRRRKDRGGVFVLALAVTAGLVAVLASLAASQRIALMAAANRMEARRAEIAAYSGLQRAIAEFGAQDTALTTNQDPWAILSVAGEDRFVVGRDSFRLEILDASSRINLNTADEAQLGTLPLTDEQIDSVLDWRSANRDARPQGAKDEFYNNLAVPYNAKLGPFDSVNELLLVRGFTPQVLYQVQEGIVNSNTITQGANDQQAVLADLLTSDSQSLNVTSTGETKLNVNQAGVGNLVQRGFPPPLAMTILQGRPYTGLGQVIQRIGFNPTDVTLVLDNLTISSATQRPGLINVNTAPESVLAAIPGMEPDVAQALVARQPTGITSLGELLSVPGFSAQVLQQVVDRLTVNSQTFLVRVEGRAGTARYLLEATLQLTDTGVQVVKVARPPFADMPTRWGWVATPSNDVIITETQ